MTYGWLVSDDSVTGAKRAAVVFNPTKVDVDRLRSLVARAADSAGFGETGWFETSAEDAGESATRVALDSRPEVLLAVGGDGTVRAVAQAVRGADVSLALIPSGTGNLLARNLELSLSLGPAVRAAFEGEDRPVDLGVVEITRPDGSTEEHVFVVVAGVGLDAKMIAMTNSRLKKAVGWLAYLDGGMRALNESRAVRLRYELNGGPPRHMVAHTLMMGNCGSLPGGMLLIPEAKIDDGVLDFVAFKPRGRFGWVRVWNKIAWENGVLRKSAVGRRIIDISRDVRDVAYFHGSDMVVDLDAPQPFQLDGDEFGRVSRVHTWVEQHALRVRVPKERER